MITVFLKGGAAAFLIFLAILNKTRNWFLGIIGFIVLIGTFFFFAPDTDYGYLMVFLGFLVGSALAIWRLR